LEAAISEWLPDRKADLPRAQHGYEYRRAAYRRMAEWLGPVAIAAFDWVFAHEPSTLAEPLLDNVCDINAASSR
jgi:hypothetical protein